MAYREDIAYEKIPPETDSAKRKDYWEIGRGLQATDGLPTSRYLNTVIEETASGKYDTAIAAEKIKNYYAELDPSSPQLATRQGDEVTARIALVLETFPFTFDPTTLQGIHKRLFDEIKPEFNPGQWRKYDLMKKEPVLNGGSVEYTNYEAIPSRLHNQFDLEKSRQGNYVPPLDKDTIRQLARFISSVWETHGFSDGNTRTIAVFLILYIRNMGYKADNEYFKEHSEFFRDALVRSNYAAAFLGVIPDFSYLEKFMENLLLKAGNDLESLDLRCKELFPGSVAPEKV
ncbi:MAG: Fic family protein [Coriobacteriia bacterium]|nr:Fic family protein [Coriobacteriia bacterium]